jgi:O-antigen/teichoic acid export membrane protein
MSHKRKILQGSASNIAKITLTMLVALVLPPLLVHRMVPAEYSAWVLILQFSAYINLLDLGLQTAVGKFVAEYDAVGNQIASSRILSNSFVILCMSALVGAVAIGIVSWHVPQLFHQMPTVFVGDLRQGILIVGLSTVLALPFGAFLAAFTGLQKYGFPTFLATSSKLLSSAALVGLLLMNGNLIQLAWIMAVFNVATAAAQFFGWARYLRDRVGFSLRLMDRETAVRLAKYGSVLSTWTIAALLTSGLDIVIVGHYDYKNTGYYGIAASATNFMLLIITSVFGPLMPAVSSMQSGRTSSQIGELVIKVTRYCTLLICLLGLPLFFGAYPLLKFWVGHSYAMRSALFLEVLVLGNAIRMIGYPYALVVVATGKQHLATIAAIAEAFVNVTVSIYLVQTIGAVGVAIGTFTGAFVTLGIHLAVSMRLTRSTIQVSRRRFVSEAVLRPLSCVIPSMLLFPFWRRSTMLPAGLPWLVLWIFVTLGIAWIIGLNSAERHSFTEALFHWRGQRAIFNAADPL